ncbi:MAG: DUF4167 domain-containing protein [Proteobacteria bacterium]|nr:DUF4167 domain-containing protein [Pseudomonadota bacterium]
MNMKRMRGRNHRSGGGGGGGGFRNQQNGIPLNRNHVFDSSGPEMRVRGTAQQLYDKYSQLARDAASSNDRVLGEAYYQHAEHYFRILSAINAAQGLPPPGQGNQNGEQRYQAQGEYQRREHGAEGESQDGREPRQENREFRDNRQGENRQDGREYREPRQENREYRENRQENREYREPRQDNRDNRQSEYRQNENRHGENRQDRRFEQRPRQEFQQRDRPNRFAAPIAGTPIDISSALEAELRAAANEEPAGQGTQPEVKPEAAVPEARAIPIKPEAPPVAAPELTLTEPANPAPKRRGRPPRAKSGDAGQASEQAEEPAKAE